MSRAHVTRELSAYGDEALPVQRIRQVEAHLRACDRCRAAYEEIRRGAQAARQIAGVKAPEGLWDEIEARAFATPAPRSRAWRRMAARAAIVILGILIGFGIWHLGSRQRLEIVAASRDPTGFELAALEAHARRGAGSSGLDYTTASPELLRAWLERAGFDVRLAIQRPAEDTGRFRAVGAKVVHAGGARAAVVEYEIDGRPVTLLTAALREVDHPPAEAAFGKRVTWRAGGERGVDLLSWASDGEAYVLVSDLPEHGTRACSLCHTDARRRDLIHQARPKPAD